MRIKILRNANYRVSSGLSQSFTAESVVSVPKTTAQALIARGDAVEVKPSTKEK